MEKQTKIIIGIIILAVALFVLPKIQLFSLLNPNEYNANADKTFLTNIKFSEPENFNDYGSGNSWVSVYWNGVNLEGFGQIASINSENDICADKPLITHTPIGFRVVKYNENDKKVGICDSSGHNAYIFSADLPRDAITNLSEGLCMNCVTPGVNCTEDLYQTCSSGVTYKAQKCVNGELEIIDYNTWPCDNVTDNQTDGLLCTESGGSWTNQTCSCASGFELSNKQCVETENFFMKEIFKINDFSVKGWMLIAAVLLILIILLFK